MVDVEQATEERLGAIVILDSKTDQEIHRREIDKQGAYH